MTTASGAATEDPSERLKTQSRALLRQGEGLVSHLSEDERRALADELARTGWRRYDRSPTVQRTMSRALSEGSRQFGLSAGSQLREASWLEQSSWTVGEPAPTQALALRTADLWTPTAADFDAMERPAPAGESALPRESKRAKLNAMREVRIAHTARPTQPAPLSPTRPAAAAPHLTSSRRARLARLESQVGDLPWFEEEWEIKEEDQSAAGRLRRLTIAHSGA